MIHGLSLFSGIGGIDLALEPWVRPVAYCEIEPYAQAVLLSRMADGLLPSAPIWPDVSTLPVRELPEVDIVYGGFPCQDISAAGTGAGLVGQRSGLFFEIVRIVRDVCPSLIFLENVPAIRSRGLARVCAELASLGFDLRWTTVSAAEVGAPHLRRRWFMLAAHPNRISIWKLQQRLPDGRARAVCNEGEALALDDGRERALADASSLGCSGRGSASSSQAPAAGIGGLQLGRSGEALADAHESGLSLGQIQRRAQRSGERADWWDVEPNVGRVAHGVLQRVDRVKALGNAVVPIAARQAFTRLLGLEAAEHA